MNRTSHLPWIAAIGLGGSITWAMYSPNSTAYSIKEAREKKTLVILGTGWGSVSFLSKLDTEQYNVIVISPQNYFLFTPLLPSCTTGLVDPRSLMEPVRSFFGDRQGAVKFYEAEAVKIDYDSRVIHIQDPSGAHGQVGQAEIPFDMLVMGVGADNATFNIPGVNEHACFLKTISDAQKVRNRIVDRIEAASFKDKSTEDIQKQLQVVVVGGGPTGVEFAAELQDFVDEDLKKQIPNIKDEFQVTLIEALPNVLPMLSKELIDYTEAKLKEQTIRVMTKTAVKRVNEGSVEVEITNAEGEEELRTIPYGLLVWATGNKPKEIVEDLATQIPEQKDLRRGLAVDEYLAVKGAPNIWALGDCANSNLPPTAQVAAQQGTYLAEVFNNMTATESQSRTEVQPFRYSHQGTLAYIGSELAVADLKFLGNTIPSGGFFTYLFWKAAYLNMCLTGKLRPFAFLPVTLLSR
ncbi:hypothetical protein BDV27DRAFT_143771 [Aspergillus caelatus]|uniref:NADH:ubiquinone reductase (non-electrogenic) n=1 Tax=Aspergillus caelatus TaxID=61420 RepID=A0A5N7A8Q6_9EURO|nr:uncharacterized protein BDV27DRAFT_143771 [Aspergillus caelatus]KAE8366257.1 hypothetical protein BDV27DRAFT_143771 [Aspergillus caelatus]